ncbi:MAG: TolC family protein [Betaproteobacteria bacterium]|nr:TolC family protein [Betaproteobacteria bacterium]
MYRTPYLPKPRLPAISLALVLGLCAPAVLADLGLNESEALRLALARPAFSDWLRGRAGEAEADALAAGIWANPSLELARDKTGASRETSWQLAQPFDLSGRRGLREDAARHRVRAVESDNLTHRNELAANVRRSFHDVLRQQETLRAVGDWAARFVGIVGVVDKLARAGEVAGYDRRRMVREQRSAEAKLAETRADLERSRARLTALIGRECCGSEAGNRVVGRLPPTAPPPLPTLQARLAERPDLAALAARAEAFQADNAAAQRNLPDVTIGIGSKRLDDSGGGGSTIAEGELAGLHRQVTQLIAAAERYRADAVAPSADLVRIAETAYRAGESTLLELLDAYKGALEAETTALALEWKAREAHIELDQLTGSHPQ